MAQLQFTKLSAHRSPMAVRPFESVLMFLVITGLSIVAGLLATTAHPILIGVFVGGILGLGLLARLDFAVWLVVIGTLFIGGMIVQFAPQLSKAAWLFSMIGFLLFAGAFFHAVAKPPGARHLPTFAWLALVFPFYAVLVSLANFLGMDEFLAGFKRYFQFWGLFAILIFVPFTEIFVRNLLRFVFGLGLLQVFFAAYQLIVVVPSRGGMGGGVVAIDAVAGTFEASSTGGGSSSILVMFVLMVFAYVLSAWRDKLLGPIGAFVASLLLLAPLAMGETKIVIVLLPLVALVVLQRDLRQNPVAGTLIMAATLCLTAALGYLYLTLSARGHDSVEQTIARVVAYNMGNVGYMGLGGLNRTTVLSFWWDQQTWGDPLAFLFGHGVGASYTGDGALVPGHLGIKYFGLSIGLTGLSTLLWDTGILGTAWVLAIFLGSLIHCQRIVMDMPNGKPRAIALAVEAGLVMNFVLLAYSNSIFSLPSHEVILMLLLASAALLRKPADALVEARSATGTRPA